MPELLIAGGALLVIARLWVPYKAGVVFKGSISAVSDICGSSAGVIAQTLRPSLQSSCNEAGAWMTALTIGAVAGLALGAFGGYLAWRVRQN